MSELYLKATSGAAFRDYFEALAGHITSYLAVDSSVRLECDRTLGFSLPAGDWSEVKDALDAGLNLVFYQVSTRSPLSIPCSQALVDLFVHQIWSPVSDARGYVHIAVPIDPTSVTITPPQTVIWNAIFGEKGYFEEYRNHLVLAGNSYLSADGDYKPCKFYLGKEGKVSKKSKTVKSDLKLITASPARKLLRIQGGRFFRALDASSDDFTGLAYCFPALQLDAPDELVLSERLVLTQPICEVPLYHNPEQDAAVRTVIWLFNATDHGVALRGTLALRPSHGLIYDFQRTILTVLSTYNKRDESDDLGPLPTSLGITRLLNICLMCLNPHLANFERFFSQNLQLAYKYLHALHRIVRSLTCPSALSESLRALRSVVIPYAGSQDAYSGMTLCCCVDEIGTPFTAEFPTPASFSGWSAMSQLFFEPDHAHDAAKPYKLFDAAEAKKHTDEEVARINLRFLHSQVDLINQLGVAMSSLVQFGPALSYDVNRIPISAKYMVGIPVDNPQVTEVSNDFSEELTTLDGSSPQELVYFEGILHLLILADSTADALGFIQTFYLRAIDPTDFKKIDAARFAILTAYAHFSELNAGTIELYNRDGLSAGSPPDPLIPRYDDTDGAAVFFNGFIDQMVIGDFNPSLGHLNIDVFTKIPGLERVADYISRCIHLPIVRESLGPSNTSARLFLLGFLRTKTNTTPEFLSHAQSNLRDPHDPAKAVTPSGALLMELSKKGGFGFGSLLGPLLGEGAKAISGLLGAPEIGDAIAGVANIAGSLIPF